MNNKTNFIPNVLTIAGTDSCGGAGVPADIKAISACGGYAMCVVTAVTAQNTVGVQQVELMPLELIKVQLDSVFSDVRVDAVKIGMLGDANIIEVVAERLTHYRTKYRKMLGREFAIVLDPVMVAKSGDRLLAERAVSALRETLMPIVTVVTPNLPEAGDLLGVPEAQSKDEMLNQAGQFDGAVFLKGGHLAGEQAPDVLVMPDEDAAPQWFESERINTKNTHGTGCTLSASIATFLGKGQPLEQACANAKDYLTEAIRHADELNVGQGHGAVHHFYHQT